MEANDKEIQGKCLSQEDKGFGVTNRKYRRMSQTGDLEIAKSDEDGVSDISSSYSKNEWSTGS